MKYRIVHAVNYTTLAELSEPVFLSKGDVVIVAEQSYGVVQILINVDEKLVQVIVM